MDDVNSSKVYLNDIRNNVAQLRANFQEINRTAWNDANRETLKEGFIVKAGRNTELILNYICSREKLVLSPKNNGGKPGVPLLNDYIYSLREKGVISGLVFHHLENIRKWRNQSVHHIANELGNSEGIKQSTIETVNDSFEHFVKWFFRIYLKDEAPHVNPESGFTTTTDIREEENKIEDHAETEDIGNSDAISVQSPPTFRGWWLIIAGLALATVAVMFLFMMEEEPKTIKQPLTMSTDEAYNFLTGYFAACDSSTFEPNGYFSDNVEPYYSQHNMSPLEIKYDKTRINFQNSKYRIDKSALTILASEKDITYWQCSCNLRYFDALDKRYHSKNLVLKFGINSERKITAIEELRSSPAY